MDKLRAALHGEYPPGVYLFRSNATTRQITQVVKSQGFRFVHLDGRTITDKQSFLQVFATALRFPAYFGRNWDALYDCLTDLSWLPAPGYVLLYDHVANFAAHHPDQWAQALDVLQSAAANEQFHAPMFVLLRDAEDFVRDVPQL